MNPDNDEMYGILVVMVAIFFFIALIISAVASERDLRECKSKGGQIIGIRAGSAWPTRCVTKDGTVIVLERDKR